MTGRWRVHLSHWNRGLWFVCRIDAITGTGRYFDTWREAFDYADRMARGER